MCPIIHIKNERNRINNYTDLWGVRGESCGDGKDWDNGLKGHRVYDCVLEGSEDTM